MTKSLGVLLALCLAGLQFLAVLMVVFSSYVTSERALITHARELLRDVGVNTIEHSKGFLSPARAAAELAARLAQHSVIASDNPVAMEQLLFQQLQMAPQLAGVYFGGADGSFVMVMHDPSGPAPFRSKVVTTAGGTRVVEFIWRSDDFTPIARRFDPEDTFDPRTRPWYINASRDQSTVWTDPYIFFSSQLPGITLAAPVPNGEGGVKGAIGVDIEISMISEFLARLNIGSNGSALIIHRNGDVIAHPRLDLVRTRSSDGSLRFANIREFDDPVARAAFGPLAATEGGVTVNAETPDTFSVDGQRYVSIVMPVISDLLPWTIAVYAPESDFTQTIKANRTQNIWIAAGVALLTGLVGLGLANFIHRPVRAFAIRSALIAQGEIDPAAPAPSTYKELSRANDALVQQIVARREAEHEYGQTFDLSSRGMAQIAPIDGAILRANARFCEITGYSSAELLGMRFADLFALGEEVTNPAAGDTQDALPTDRALRLLRKDQASVWVTINTIMLRDDKGGALHSVVMLDDITVHKAQEQQISQLSRDLAHLARGNTMGQLASGLAHELNQPLTAIAQNADSAILTLQDQGHSDPELLEILTEIERQSLRAGEIIRALRGFIRKDEGSRVAFEIGDLLEQTRGLVRAEAVEAGVVIDIPTGLMPKVMGNRVQIAQVLVNLMRNAIESIASDLKNERWVGVTTLVEGGKMTVSVQDSGPGISPSITLFNQFETTKAEGMGLGLSICRNIIESNGGTLWHESVGPRGAKFSFTLELAEPSGKAAG